MLIEIFLNVAVPIIIKHDQKILNCNYISIAKVFRKLRFYFANSYRTELTLQNTKSCYKAKKVIFAFASHHRLMRIHPFLDGNGSTTRLILDDIFLVCNQKDTDYGISREESSQYSEDYKHYLALPGITQTRLFGWCTHTSPLGHPHA